MTSEAMYPGGRPYPRTYPLGWSSDPAEKPGELEGLPTLAEFATIKRERCRHKLAATRTKALAAAVFAELGEASRGVLAGQGLTIRPDGTVHSLAEQEVDDDFVEIASALHAVHGAALKLPCDAGVDPETGCVFVVPHTHDAPRESRA